MLICCLYMLIISVIFCDFTNSARPRKLKQFVALMEAVQLTAFKIDSSLSEKE